MVKMATLVGYDNFKKNNPRRDKFGINKFHHIEFWCADATNAFKRYKHSELQQFSYQCTYVNKGLGAKAVPNSHMDASTCTHVHVYALLFAQRQLQASGHITYDQYIYYTSYIYQLYHGQPSEDPVSAG